MTTHSEMPRLAYLMIITRHRFSGGSETSLRLGRTATKTVGGIETVSYDYNIRSWPTKIQSAKFTELMGYNASVNGMTVSHPRWNGDISALCWKGGAEGATYRGYEFDYDDMDRLVCAWYGGGLNFSGTEDYYDEYFTYDRMGNITNLMRGGRLDDNSYSLIDDLDMEYDGNRLTRVYDYSSDDDPTYEGVMQFTDNSDEDVEYEYDANGNLTKDLNANISSIRYNCLNLPSRVTVVSGGPSSLQYKVMDITYNADGEKLYVSPSSVMEIWPVLSPLQGGGAVQQQGGALPGGDPGPGTGTAPFDDPAIQDLSTRYCGNVVFERGEIARVLTDEGYITFAPNGKPMRHYYLRDHLGNIRVVFNQTDTVEQRNDYYPSGALMATSTGGSVQPYKYNGKELERMNGLDLYDYGARWMDSKIGARFTTMDPLCEKYYDISPYAYCAGNPVNLIDPDGRDYTVYVDNEYGTIQISAFYYCSAEDYNRCLEDCNYWNQQSGNYSAGNYIVNFSLTPIIVSNSIENISIEEDNLTIISDLLSDKQALNYTLNNDYLTDSNSYQIVNNLGKDENGNIVNGKTISGRVILVGSSNTQTGKHEIGHSLGIGHHNIGIMTPASSDANRNDQISHSYIKEILKGSLPEKGVPGAGKGHLIINGFGFDVKVFDRIKKTGL